MRPRFVDCHSHVVPSGDDGAKSHADGIDLCKLAALSERERQVLVLRYGLSDYEPKTLEEIGRRLGLTRERVRQIEVEALKRLATLHEMEAVAYTA